MFILFAMSKARQAWFQEPRLLLGQQFLWLLTARFMTQKAVMLEDMTMPLLNHLMTTPHTTLHQRLIFFPVKSMTSMLQ